MFVHSALPSTPPPLLISSHLTSTHDGTGTYYAVQQAIALGLKAQESTLFLLDLLDKLEEMKKQLAHNEAVSDEAAASAHVENFALKIFGQADAEDRAGNATKSVLSLPSITPTQPPPPPRFLTTSLSHQQTHSQEVPGSCKLPRTTLHLRRD